MIRLCQFEFCLAIIGTRRESGRLGPLQSRPVSKVGPFQSRPPSNMAHLIRLLIKIVQYHNAFLFIYILVVAIWGTIFYVCIKAQF